MDAIFNGISRYGTKLINELGQIAQKMDGTGWVILSAVLLVCGWFFLKGNKIRST
jgi:formate hydrogenlyase subunit 3/multisubunit Na+/H+ antiporter MnhD subunit